MATTTATNYDNYNITTTAKINYQLQLRTKLQYMYN